MGKTFVRPAPHAEDPTRLRMVRDPQTHLAIPDAGCEVTLDGPVGSYWRRRIRFGDVLEGRQKLASQKKVQRGEG